MSDSTKPEIAASTAARRDTLAQLAPQLVASHLIATVSVPANFHFGAVSSTLQRNSIHLFSAPPSLGSLESFFGAPWRQAPIPEFREIAAEHATRP